jgi:hypothetical protein
VSKRASHGRPSAVRRHTRQKKRRGRARDTHQHEVVRPLLVVGRVDKGGALIPLRQELDRRRVLKGADEVATRQALALRLLERQLQGQGRERKRQGGG